MKFKVELYTGLFTNKRYSSFFFFFVFVWWSNNTYFPKSTNFNVVEGCSGSRSSNRIYIINNRILSSSSHRSNRIYSRMWNMKWWTKINLPAEWKFTTKMVIFFMIKLVQQRLATNVSSFFFGNSHHTVYKTCNDFFSFFIFATVVTWHSVGVASGKRLLSSSFFFFFLFIEKILFLKW